MKIGYITTYDATDVNNWSGLGYYISKALKEQFEEFYYIGNLREKYSTLFKFKTVISKYIFNKNYLRRREPIILRSYAHQVGEELSGVKIDIVFSPTTLPIAYLEIDRPIVFWTDATFAGMIDFYPNFSNLGEETVKNGNAMEKSALDRCRLAIYSSEWAAQTAINYYEIDPSKVKIVPFGANIHCNRNFGDIRKIVNSRPSNKCKLLFLGVDWLRKGGDMAFKIAKELNKSGLETELTIAGCQPTIEKPVPNFVRSLGFISKSTEKGSKKINDLLAESHFLILPSRAEAFGIVFCEANSFGVPCLSTNVGGIPTVIKDGLNGKLFSKDANITEYCTYISNLFLNYSQYKNLALSSFNEYQSRLNWSVAGHSVKKLLMELAY